MSLLAYLIDRTHHALVCRRRSRALLRRLRAGREGAKGRSLTLEGRYEPKELLVAPLSGARVVGYRVLLEVPAENWINRRVVVDFGRLAGGRFTPARDTGLRPLEVEGGAVDLLVPEPCLQGRRRGGSQDEPQGFPDEVARVLAERAQIRAEARDPHRYRWAEYHLHGNEALLAWGAARRSEGDDGQQMVFGAAGEQPFFVSTAPWEHLAEGLDDPDVAWLRALPGPAFDDRSAE